VLGLYFCAVGIVYHYIVLLLQTRPAEPVACRQHFASRCISNEKISFNPSPGKDEIEQVSNFENLQAVYLWKQALHY